MIVFLAVIGGAFVLLGLLALGLWLIFRGMQPGDVP